MLPIISAGSVLLSEPFMLDPNFKRSAVLVVDHNDQGSVGFMLSRKLDFDIHQIVENFPEFDAPVYNGGPVGRDTIHYLHRKGDLIEGSDEVARGVFWGGDYQQVKFLVRTGVLQPADIRFFVGYSGWSQGQLQEELNRNSWMTAPMDANYLFGNTDEKLWSQVMRNKGRHYSVIADMEEEASYN